MAVSHDVKRLQ